MTSFLLVATVLVAQVEAASPSDDMAVQVRRLVRQLDATELGVRNQAEDELVRLGPAVLDLLPTEPRGSAELQQRLARVRQTLEKTAAAESAKNSTVTLRGSMPLADALAALEKQTGNPIVDFRQRFGQEAVNPDVKTDFDKTPFWQALDAILDQARLTVYHYSNDEGLAIIGRPEKQLPRVGRAAYVGPLRLEVTRLTAERVPTMEIEGTLKVLLQIAWEPRLTPITFQQPLSEIEAVDDQGNPLQFDQREGELEAAVQGGTAVELTLPLAAPPRSAKSIASLQGSMAALLPGKTEAFEFDKLAELVKPDSKPVEQKRAAATVALDKVRKNGEIWEVRMRVRFDAAANALESHRTWIFQNEAYMIGPESQKPDEQKSDEQKIEHAGFETTLRSENEVGVAYLFELPDGVEGHTFVYKSPTSLHVVPVKYELKNLPLP